MNAVHNINLETYLVNCTETSFICSSSNNLFSKYNFRIINSRPCGISKTTILLWEQRLNTRFRGKVKHSYTSLIDWKWFPVIQNSKSVKYFQRNILLINYHVLICHNNFCIIFCYSQYWPLLETSHSVRKSMWQSLPWCAHLYSCLPQGQYHCCIAPTLDDILENRKKNGFLHVIVQTVCSYWLAIQVASSKRSVEEIALVFWVISLILILARCIKY